jgi:membrane-associated phospholipid phosphatase
MKKSDLKMQRVPTEESSETPPRRTYLVDVLAIAALTATLLLLGLAEPFQQKITDQLEPIKPVIISTSLCIVVSAVIPAILSMLITRSIRFAVSITVGALLVSVFTDVVKLMMGELRPDFTARCLPKDNVCTGDPALVREGRLSFPSGHASLAFFGLLLFSLFLYRNLAHKVKPIILIILNSGIMLVAVYIGISR